MATPKSRLRNHHLETSYSESSEKGEGEWEGGMKEGRRNEGGGETEEGRKGGLGGEWRREREWWEVV